MTLTIQAHIEQFDLPHPGGEGKFQISVSRHAGAGEGAKDVPVLVVLDGDAFFALAAEIAKLRGVGGMTPTAMVVGVGYEADWATMGKLRTADLTPPLSEAGRQAMGGLSQLVGDREGGAEAFLTFLTDTLRPEILARYPEASSGDQILFGHSLAGLFTAYALLTRPDSFATFISSSPALWWDNFAIFSHLPALPERLNGLERQPRVLVCVGSKEQDLPVKTLPNVQLSLEELQAMVTQSRMVDAAAEFAEELRKLGIEDLAHVPFDQEDHLTVVPAALTRGLALAVPAA